MIISQKLFRAVKKGDLDTIRSELARGVNVDVKDQSGKTALYYSILYSKLHHNIEAIKLLLESRASVDVQDISGETVLHIATRHNPEVIKLLLEYGASINTETYIGATALHIAAQYNFKALEILLQYGANIDVQSKVGSTALHIAAQYNFKALEILLQHGANVDVQSKFGSTALHIAVEHGNVEALEILLRYGANIDVQSKFGSTALHVEVERDNVEAMEILLKHGASVDVQDMGGYTALHHAVDNHNVQATSILLEYGADATLKNRDSESPFSGLMNSRRYDTEFMDKLIAIHLEKICYVKPEDYDFDQLHFGEEESQDYINHGVVARYNSLRILEELKQVNAICIKQSAEIALNNIPENVRQDLVASYERHNEMFIEKLIYDPIIKKFSGHELMEPNILPFIVELAGIPRGAINDVDIRKCLVEIQNPQEVFDQDLIGEDMDAF